jgi:5'-nucleotidase
MDAVLMRKDPPFDNEYFYATHLLTQAEREGARVFNHPSALREHPEKLALMEFAQWTTPTLVTRSSEAIRAFHATHQDIILKPLDGMGGMDDLVVSGINNGANMGDDTIYSGTVGAAMEGYLYGIPAIAFSQVNKDWLELASAARKAREFVLAVQQAQLVGGAAWLLNVNIPNLPYADIRSAQLCRLGKRHAAEPVIKQTSPRGETMYWIGAAGPVKDEAQGTDFYATSQGHIAVTPLSVDLTDHDNLGAWGQHMARMSAP